MLHVLFLGDRGHHRPADRLAEVYGPLSRAGFAIDWEEDVSRVTADRLADYDVVWMYANQAQDRVVPPQFYHDLAVYLEQGGGLFALHCTSGCYMESPQWRQLIGARFLSHGSEVFTQEVVAPDHPLMKGWEPFTSWDETYVQEHQTNDRLVLSRRGEEPWSWVKQFGKGRIYYNASGHDSRTWKEPQFLNLVQRSLDWCAGEEAAANRKAWSPPEFQFAEESWVPNYEGRDPHPLLQLPSTPDQALKSLIVPAGFRAELFAAEPMVVNPVAMTWDSQGRCWVAESPDYPNRVLEDGSGNDRISILHDEDGDGRADRKAVFCDNLNLPTGLLKTKHGLLVSQAPNLMLHKDADGDDRCDAHEIQFSGFGRWDTHAGPSHLRLGPDNRIWGAIGYAGFTRADGTSFGSGLWSWVPGEAEPRFEAQFTNNTWGLGFRADGEIFGSTANGAPAFHVGAPKPLLARTEPDAAGAAPIFETAAIHPTHPQIIQGDWFGNFTAAAGFSFGTGDRLPPGWDDDSAYVCAPTGRLVARLSVVRDGSGFQSRDAFNLCSSLDAWFCPVQAEVGPDGAFWIADFSQFLVLHNLPGDPERGLPEVSYGDGNAHRNPLRDSSHGRIFRLVPDTPGTPAPDLRSGKPDSLIEALGHPNAFWRTTARRLFLASPDPEEDIRRLGKDWFSFTETQQVEILRLCTKYVSHEPYGWPSRVMIGALMGSRYEISRPLLASLSVFHLFPRKDRFLGLSFLLEDRRSSRYAPHVQRHALMALARSPHEERAGIDLASYALTYDAGDPWLRSLLLAAATQHAESFLTAIAPMVPVEPKEAGPNLLVNGDFEAASSEDPERPVAWRVRSYGGEAQHAYHAAGGRNDSAFLRIQSNSGADTSWCTDVPVEPATRYRLSGWIRTEGMTHPGNTHGALLNVHPRHWVTEYVQDTQDWTRVQVEFETGPEEDSVSLNCLYGGWGHSTGTADFDDLELVALGPSQNLRSLVDKVRLASGIDSDSMEARTPEDLLWGGDAENGRRLFLQHKLATCNRCHVYEGEGGSIGPDLTDIASRLDRQSILESILDPNAVMAEGWTAPVSAMPALAPFLTDEEIRDLVEFLASGQAKKR